MLSTSLFAEQENDTGQGNVTEVEDDSDLAEGNPPFFTRKFIIGAGAYFPSIDFDVRADGSIPGVDIDFAESVGVKKSDDIFSTAFRWNFGKKWSFWGQYFQSDQDKTAALKEDVHWEDVVFREGSYVKAGTEIKVARVLFGREFKSNHKYEFGAGLGLHWLEMGAFIEGEALIGDDTAGFYRGDVDGSFPLPDIGAWFTYKLNHRWLASARADWLSASYGDYSGSMTDAAITTEFLITENIAAHLSYLLFRVDLDIKKNDWKGSADLKFRGPFLALVFAF